MLLGKSDIQDELDANRLTIDPVEDEQLQPASVDLTLGDEFIVYNPTSARDPIDPNTLDNLDRHGTKIAGREITIDPEMFLLATTQETVGLPTDIAGEVKGVSSIGRLGLIPHTAGFVDPGFEGQITLELKNHNSHAVQIEPGMRICQITFNRLETEAPEGYGEKDSAKYQNQQGVTASRYDSEREE